MALSSLAESSPGISNCSEAHLRDALVLSVKLPDAAGKTIYFPTLQTCEQGQTDWSEMAKEGQDPHDLKARHHRSPSLLPMPLVITTQQQRSPPSRLPLSPMMVRRRAAGPA